jgi:uroporphyrinogen decarboxylase
MPKESMTAKERWLAVLARKKPDRVPMDFWATDEASEKLVRHLGCGSRQEALQKLHVDYSVWVLPRYRGPLRPPMTDMYGCRYVRADYGGGAYAECVLNPLAGYESVDEIEANYTWPSADWFDYSGLSTPQPDEGTHPVVAGGSEPFLTYKNLRGQQRAFMDLVEKPEIVHYCLDKLFGLAYEMTSRIYEQMPGRVTLSHVAEDMGAQEGLMYSPEHIRMFLLPGMKRMIDLAHSAGVKVQHHNDGAIRRILPDLIDIGIDVLNPVQWRCKGMEREGLKRDFGDKIVFHGGMDNQYTLAFGSVEEVRQEVRDNLRILGRGGGYILAPCHNIQAVSPPENIVAMYEEGYSLGWTS